MKTLGGLKMGTLKLHDGIFGMNSTQLTFEEIEVSKFGGPEVLEVVQRTIDLENFKL